MTVTHWNEAANLDMTLDLHFIGVYSSLHQRVRVILACCLSHNWYEYQDGIPHAYIICLKMQVIIIGIQTSCLVIN